MPPENNMSAMTRERAWVHRAARSFSKPTGENMKNTPVRNMMQDAGGSDRQNSCCRDGHISFGNLTFTGASTPQR